MLFAEAVISHSLGCMTVKCEMHAVVVFARDFPVGFCVCKSVRVNTSPSVCIDMLMLYWSVFVCDRLPVCLLISEYYV